MHDQPNDALRALIHAQSLATDAMPAIVARIVFLLGSIYIDRNELRAADAALAWADGLLGGGTERCADILHLRALLAETRGSREDAVRLYREALRRAASALTPMTRVLLLRNLAATLVHSEPTESTGLYGLALAVLEAEELDDVTRCAIDNGMGYVLLCAGDIDGARLKLEQAHAESQRIGSARVGLYARFNLAIADELVGELESAARALESVEHDARAAEYEELANWCVLRHAWIAYRSGSRQHAGAMLRRLPLPPGVHGEATRTLRAILAVGDGSAKARRELATLAARYGERGDALMDFTLTLWVARADAVGGRLRAARQNVLRACENGAAHGFRVSTSWWIPELVELARDLAPPEHEDYVGRLIAPPPRERAAPAPGVVISRDGGVSIDARSRSDALWREGRTGAGVLKRYFRVLVSAYPAALLRDELADLLWPESEGDKAVRNLYAATHDLRRALSALPGVRLVVSEGAYRLAFGDNVTLR